MEDELVVYDHIKLNPAEQDMKEIGFMEGYSHLGSMIVIGEQTNGELLDRLYHSMNLNEQDYKLGLSMLPVKGFTIRVLANKTQTIERIFTECHQMISEDWFNTKPSFLRKY